MSRSEGDLLTDEFLNRAATAVYNLFEFANERPEFEPTFKDMTNGILLLVGHVARTDGFKDATVFEVMETGRLLVDARLQAIADDMIRDFLTNKDKI